MRNYDYELKRQNRSLDIRQYVYWIGPYRYNWHEALELMLILKGNVEISCGGKTLHLEEDDLLLIDSNIGHASLAKEEGSMAMVIHLNPDYLRDYYQPFESYTFSGHTDERNRNQSAAIEVRSIMSSMIARMDTRNPLEMIRYEQELNRLLYLLFQMFPPRRQQEGDCIKKEKQKGVMEHILKYVEDHYQERLSLADLSRVSQYNTSYLSTYFKNQVGINFYDYLTRIRLREATLELCSTDKTVLEIAGNHGFPDVKAFNTCFRKAFGKSPREYRKQILEENRGMDFREKRIFLKIDDEYVNQKLEKYQEARSVYREEGLVFAGTRMLHQELADSLLEHVKTAGMNVESLGQEMEQLQKTIEKIKRLL